MNNCGACGAACAAGQVCNLGICSDDCHSTTRCGDICTFLSDRNNCGACDHACKANEECNANSKSCVACAAAQTLCGDSCVDLKTNEGNCGSCGVVCGMHDNCVAGRCTKDPANPNHGGCFSSVVPGPPPLAFGGTLALSAIAGLMTLLRRRQSHRVSRRTAHLK